MKDGHCQYLHHGGHVQMLLGTLLEFGDGMSCMIDIRMLGEVLKRMQVVLGISISAINSLRF